MKRIILFIMAVSCIAVPAAAQQATPTETATPTGPAGAPDDVELVVNENIVVVDYRYEDRQMVVDWYADTPVTITVAPTPEPGSEAGTVRTHPVLLDGETVTTSRTRSAGGISFFVDDSAYHYLRRPGNSLISGPWTARDVQTAALSGAGSVGIVSIIIVIRTVTGRTDEPERVA